ncbi:hypothetical protein LCGC14_2758580, partial [marine sediment metagenome]
MDDFSEAILMDPNLLIVSRTQVEWPVLR